MKGKSGRPAGLPKLESRQSALAVRRIYKEHGYDPIRDAAKVAMRLEEEIGKLKDPKLKVEMWTRLMLLHLKAAEFVHPRMKAMEIKQEEDRQTVTLQIGNFNGRFHPIGEKSDIIDVKHKDEEMQFSNQAMEYMDVN